MWEYLDHVAVFLTNIGKVLKSLPSSEKSLVRQGLSSATKRYTSSQSTRRKTRTPRTESRAIPFITGNDGQLLPGRSNEVDDAVFEVWSTLLLIAGVLLYFSNGLLPLLTAYYKEFFVPSRDRDTRQRQMAVSAKIASALLVSQMVASRNSYTQNMYLSVEN